MRYGESGRISHSVPKIANLPGFAPGKPMRMDYILCWRAYRPPGRRDMHLRNLCAHDPFPRPPLFPWPLRPQASTFGPCRDLSWADTDRTLSYPQPRFRRSVPGLSTLLCYRTCPRVCTGPGRPWKSGPRTRRRPIFFYRRPSVRIGYFFTGGMHANGIEYAQCGLGAFKRSSYRFFS